MAKFCVLASSSKGNSSWLSSGDTSVLIDAGISCRRIVNGIAQAGGEATSLSAVLITHEHTDHIKGLLNLLKKTNAEVYASAPVLDYITANNYILPNTVLHEVDDTPFAIGDIEVKSFKTPHDSVGSRGYRFTTQSSETVGIATDLGHITDEVRAGIIGCRTVLLESNYDKRLLQMGSYPWFLKQRISSEHGHLENSDCAKFAAELVENGAVRLMLGHLSRENNNPSLARQTSEMMLNEHGAIMGVDFQLDVADYDEPSRVVRF